MKHRILVLIAAAFVALAGTLVWRQHQADNDPRYANVISIADAPVYQDAALLERAWALPVAAAYRADGFEYQTNPSFCGPTSAANLLQSQGVNVTQQSVLNGTDIRPILGILPLGLTLDQEAEVLRASTGQRVDVLRDLSLDDFRVYLARTNDLSGRYVINFHRGPLFGRGHGHLSPILGYLVQEDLVFVGDVNRDFQPFLVPTARLYEAMNTVDSQSGQKRGLLFVDASGPPRAASPQR